MQARQTAPIDRLQLYALPLGQHEHVAFGSDVHLRSRRFEAVRHVRAQEVNAQAPVNFADVADPNPMTEAKPAA
jgi:hypothetical protein